MSSSARAEEGFRGTDSHVAGLGASPCCAQDPRVISPPLLTDETQFLENVNSV